MGGGTYSTSNRQTRSISKGYATKSKEAIFSSKLHESMKSVNATYRESRDSDEHPNSFPVILTLDVTGSMGDIPHNLIKGDLPKIMGGIIEGGFPDPQLLFLAVGDHKTDRAPLQVGQFESNDEALDMWLERTWLESGGGGNGGESYPLAWMFAGMNTEHDSYLKRGKKGLLITIGDENFHNDYSQNALKEIFGKAERSYTAKEMLESAQELYDVYHIHINHGWRGESEAANWKKLLPENLIIIENMEEVSKTVLDLVKSRTLKEDFTDNVEPIEEKPTITEDEIITPVEEKEEFL